MDKNVNYVNRSGIIPDILIEYQYNHSDFNPVSVIYVRPETNMISYEKAILKGIKNYADVIYMANISGKLFIKDAMILDHYASQYKFSIYGKDEIIKFPEMIYSFEEHFKTSFESAKIIGSFDAILQLNANAEELFSLFVEDKDYLKFFGQSIKKYKDYYIVNYDLPAIINRYDGKCDVFIIVISFKNPEISPKEINESIASQIKNDKNAKFFDGDKYDNMDLIEKAKRTYHFSSNHIMAMYDMTDFVFKNNEDRISIDETPLGGILIKNGIITAEKLRIIRENPVVYLKKDGEKKLINIIEDLKNLSLNDCIELMKNIIC